MKYKYLVCYHIGGLHLPNGKNEINLTKDDFNNYHTILTSDVNSQTFLYDRQIALANILLNATFGGVDPNPIPERTREEITKIQENRIKKFGNKSFLVFEFSGEIQYCLPKTSRDTGDYILAFDNENPIDVNEIKKFTPIISKTLAALFLTSSRDFKIEKVISKSYLIDNNGKPIYSLSFSGSMNPTISSPMTEDLRKKITKYIQTNYVDINLESVYRLLTQATTEHKDKLRAFLFSWTAFEIFIHKTFKIYKPKFIEAEKLNEMPTLSQKYFKRIEEEKYSLVDEFIVVSCLLSDHYYFDLEVFVKIKVIRDKFLHGEKISEKNLPNNKLLVMLKKYLKLHLENKNF